MIKRNSIRDDMLLAATQKGLQSKSNKRETNAIIKSSSQSKRIFQSLQQNILKTSHDQRQSTPDLQIIRDRKARLISEMTDLRSEIVAKNGFEVNERKLVIRIFQFLYSHYADIFGFKEIIDKLRTVVFSEPPSGEQTVPGQSAAKHIELPRISFKRDSYLKNAKILKDLFNKERNSNFGKEFDHKLSFLITSYGDARKTQALELPTKDDSLPNGQNSSHNKLSSLLQKPLSGSKASLILPRKSLVHYRKSERFKSFLLTQLGRTSQTSNYDLAPQPSHPMKTQTDTESYEILRQNTQPENVLTVPTSQPMDNKKPGKENSFCKDRTYDPYFRRDSLQVNHGPVDIQDVTFKDLCLALQQQCAVLEVKNRELKRRNKTLTHQLKSIKDEKSDFSLNTEGMRKFAELERKISLMSKEKFETTRLLLKTNFEGIECRKQLKDMHVTSAEYLKIAENERRMRENALALCKDKDHKLKILQLGLDKMTFRVQNLEQDKVTQDKLTKEMFSKLTEIIDSNLRDELLLTRLRNESLRILKESTQEISDDEFPSSQRNSSYERRSESPDLQELINVKTRYSDSPSSQYRRKLSKVNDQSDNKLKRSMFGSNAESRSSKLIEMKPLKQKFNDAVQTISKHLLTKKEIQRQLADPNSHTPIKELIGMSESLFATIKSLGATVDSWKKRLVSEVIPFSVIDH
jgi:hypothetical protein